MCVTSQPNDLCQVVQCREVTFKHAGACITCCPVPESGWLLVGRAGAQRVYSCHAVPGVPCPAPLVSPCRKHRSRYGNHDIPCSRHTPQALVAKQSGQLQPSTIPAARLLMASSFVAKFAQRNLHWQWVRTTRTIKSSVLICWGGGGGRGGRRGRKVRDEVYLDLLHLWSSLSQTSRTQVVVFVFSWCDLYISCVVWPSSYHSPFVLMWPSAGELLDVTRHISLYLSWVTFVRSVVFYLDVISLIRPTSHKWCLVLMGNSLYQLCMCDHAHITRLSSWSDLSDVTSVICVVFLSWCDLRQISYVLSVWPFGLDLRLQTYLSCNCSGYMSSDQSCLS